MTTAKKETAVEKKDQATAVELTRDQPVFSPATDIYERDDALVVVCDMPGVDDKHVDITLEEGVLTITGYAQTEEPANEEPLYRGYETGVFRRAFTLGADVDPEKIHARISNGVLRVELGKAEKAKRRQIPVQTA